MTTRTWVMSAALAFGLALSGCGAAEEDADEATAVEPADEEVTEASDDPIQQAAPPPAAPAASDGVDDLEEETAEDEGEGAFDMEE